MPKFELCSKFKPTGDQPQAIKLLLEGINKGDKGQVLLGATGTGKTFTMANIIQETQRPALIICHNKTLAAQLCAEFQEFFPRNSVCYFVSYYDYYQPEAYVAKTDTYIEKETAINAEIEKYRHAATVSLLSRRDTIIIASVSAIYGLGDVSVYNELVVELVVGQEYIREVLFKKLVELQFNRAIGDFKQGKFNVLGDTIEIFPPSGDNIIRLEFFGDELEKIEEADGFTGEVYHELSQVKIFPASHNVTTKARIEQAIPAILEEMNEQYQYFLNQGAILFAERIKTRTEYDIEMMRETGYCTGIENYVRYLNGTNAGDPSTTLLNYFPEDFLMFVDESHMTMPQIRGMYNGNLARKQNLVNYGFRLPSAYDNRPLKFNEFEQFMRQVLFVSATPQPYEFEFSKNKIVQQIIRPTGLVDPQIEVRNSEFQVDDALREIKLRISRDERVLITTTTKKLAEKMADYLTDNDINAKYLHSEIDTFDRVEILKLLRLGSKNQGIDVVVGINLLREGLDLPEVSLICIFDADKEGFLRSKDALIQIVGRAARNINGTVLMYAIEINKKLNITKAMQACIDETNRRKEIQIAYNKTHNITPTAIKKDIFNLSETKNSKDNKTISNIDTQKIPKSEINRLLQELKDQMEIAIQNLDFETAAELRDQIEMLKNN